MCTAAGNTTATPLPTTTEWLTDYNDIVSKFSLRTADIPDDDMCYIEAGRPETIEECEFNSETQTFIIIHGWTVSRRAILLLNFFPVMFGYVCALVLPCSKKMLT